MEEVLLNIGSIVQVEYENEIGCYLIVGKRMVNTRTMKAWDYYSVPYPQGCVKDKDAMGDNGFYFNHPNIENVIYKCSVKV